MYAAPFVILATSLAAAYGTSIGMTQGQPGSLARAVASAPDGVVRMTYASRPGVCGQGDRYISFRETFHSGAASGYGRMSHQDCAEGPVRVSLTVERGRPVRVRTGIATWGGSDTGRVTDLGVVPAGEAAAYLLSVVPQLEQWSSSRALLPAVIADSADVVPALLRLMNDRDRRAETRRHAMHWARTLGGERAVAAVRAVVEDASEETELRRHAIFALSMRDAAAAPQHRYLHSLLDRLQDRRLREQVVFALSRGDDPEATDALIRVARTDRDPEVRKKAWFWLGRMKDPRAERAIAEMVLR